MCGFLFLNELSSHLEVLRWWPQGSLDARCLKNGQIFPYTSSLPAFDSTTGEGRECGDSLVVVVVSYCAKL